MNESDKFSICFNYGGKVIKIGNEMIYDGGILEYVHGLDIDRFGYFDLEEAIQKLGVKEWEKIYYVIPGIVDLSAMKHVYNDTTVMEMLGHVLKDNSLIYIYVDLGMKGTDGLPHLTNIIRDEKEFEGEIEQATHAMKVNEKTRMSETSDSCEDEDYLPVDESSSNDESHGTDDHDLASDDEEYMQARQNICIFSNHLNEDEREMGRSVCAHNEDQGVWNKEPHCDFDSDCDYAIISEQESDEEFEHNEVSSARINKTRIIYDPACDHKTLEFKLGMRFESVEQCKRAIQMVAIVNGHDIQNMKTNQNQVKARCAEGCPWRFYASKISSEGRFAIKTLINEHRCHRNMQTRQTTSEWIAKEYVETFRKNPNWTISQLEEDILKNYAVQPSRWKLYRGKWKALEMLRGSVIQHYSGLRSYMAELMRVDREGRFEFLLEDDHVFKAFYVGFSSNKKGFLQGCRPVIGFDGCFLKTFLGGALLCATAKDGNNQMYPIAWAVVETENESCWKWFLTILFQDLGINDGLGYTFLSDQQKGLTNAIMELTPHAEHRNCARHIYMNWKKKFKGQKLKNIYWRIVLSTHVAGYNIALEDLKEEDEIAYKDFLERDLRKFCKAFISTNPRSDMIENNISETFNGYIVKARGKHIIEMLEDIRGALMTRQHDKLMEMSGITDVICPRIRKKLDSNKFMSILCVTKPAVGDRFQVAFEDDQFVVDLKHYTCTCRSWDLTGIPCIHACSAIHFLKKDAAQYVHGYYSVQKYIGMYSNALEPLNGKKMWPAAHGYAIKPPPFKKMPGRPKKKRTRAPEEERLSNTRLKRFGLQMTCQRCLETGHNKKTCKKDQVQKPPNRKRGRPKKSTTSELPNEGSKIVGTTNTARKKLPIRKVTQPKLNQQHDGSTLQKERNLARKGFGVLQFEDTGNVYMRMPSERRLHFFPGRNNGGPPKP